VALGFRTVVLESNKGNTDMENRMTENSQPLQEQTTFTGCFARLFWMGAGTVALLLLTALIAQKEALSLTLFDLGLWVVAAAMVAVRYLDISRLRGQTIEGQPATLADWRKYSVSLAVVTLALWIAAHLVAATHLLK
jgi:hypothetical protein